MSSNSRSRFAFRVLSRRAYSLIFLAALAGYITLVPLMLGHGGLASLRLQFNPEPVLAAPLIVQIHIVAALTSFVIGLFLLAGVKGNWLHRLLGYIWIAAMLVTALGSFFLTGMNPGRFSAIHVLSAWVVIALPMGLAAARRHNIKTHRRFMTGLFAFGLLIAGLFAFLPGRLLWSVFVLV